MKNYPVMDPNNKGGRFIYTVMGTSPDEGVNLADRFESVLSFLSNKTLNSEKFDKLLNLFEDDKALYVLSHKSTAVNWDLIRDYARKDDLDSIYKGISGDINKLYNKLSKHEHEDLPEL